MPSAALSNGIRNVTVIKPLEMSPWVSGVFSWVSWYSGGEKWSPPLVEGLLRFEIVVAWWSPASRPDPDAAARELLETFRQEKDQLLITQSFECPHGKIHRYLASVIALEGDRHACRLDPPIRKTAGPRGFESAPVQTCSIGESTHLADILLARGNSDIAGN